MTMRQQLDEVEIRPTADADATVLEPEQRSKDKTDWWPGAGAGWDPDHDRHFARSDHGDRPIRSKARA